MKSYPVWVFTTVVGLSTLVLGVGFMAAGFQDLGQPAAEHISLGVGILFLVANPAGYMFYRKETKR